MKKAINTTLKICLYILMGTVYLNLLYRIIGYALLLATEIYNTIYDSFLYITFDYGSFNRLFDMIYFDESAWLFALASAVGFVLSASVIAALYHKYLSRKTVISIASAALFPILFPQLPLFGMPKVLWLVSAGVGIIIFVVYIILTAVFLKKDSENFDFEAYPEK